MEIILNGVDPRWFNLVASLIAEILQMAGAYTLCAVLHWMISLYLLNGNTIPAKALGPLPDSLVAALRFAHNMKWAWPATVALLLFISDYSTVIAFAGLDFELVDQEGPPAPVLNLGVRNQDSPYAAVGDPLLPFTSSRLELLLGESTRHSPLQQEEILQLAAEETMVASFLGAADAIARGESVFLEQNEDLSNDPTLLVVGRTDHDETTLLGNLTDSTVIYGSSSFLASIHHALPLTCSEDVRSAIEEQRDQDTWMTAIEEHHGPDDWTTISRVPNCTFTSPRTPGIYGEDGVNKSPEITAYARVGSGVDAKLQTQTQGPVDDGSTFVFPYEGLYLARELSNFREGRRVFGFEGAQIGNLDIPFADTVVSSGSSLANPPAALDPTDQNTLPTREYTLTSSVKDAPENCPRDPSGSQDSVCMVTAKITCETFGSEIGYGGLLHGYGGASGEGTDVLDLQHRCVFNGDVEIIWGTNYDVDLQLLAAVAGVQSRNVGWASSLLQKRTLAIHSIPSALFLLGSLDSRASVEQVRSTTINSIFIIFMCVPACLCVVAGCVYLIGRKYLLPLPDDGQAAMELGAQVAQQHEIHATSMHLKAALSCPFGWNGVSLVSDTSGCNDACLASGRSEDRPPHDDNIMNDPAEQVVVDVDEIIEGRDQHVSGSKEGVPVLVEPKEDWWKDLTGIFGLFSDPRDSNESNAPVKGVITMRQQKDYEKGSLDAESSQNTKGPSNKSLNEENASDMSTGSDLVKAGTGDNSVGSGSGGIYVAGCMAFCIAVAILAGGFIRGKSVGSDNIQNSHQPESLLSPIKHQDPSDQQERDVPSHCFVDSNQLRTSLLAYLYGSEDAQTTTLGKHGPFEDWCVDYVDDMSFMFADIPRKYKLNASGWNVSGVTKFSFCFYNYDFSDNVFDISKWDVSSGVYFHGMFSRAKGVKSDLSKWNVSSGIAFNSMFQSSSIHSDISGWDVSSANNFNGMFAQTSFSPNLSRWDVSSVTDFSGMFRGATFSSDISQWDVSSGADFSGMFHEATFNSNISQWDVSSATDFSGMFSSVTFNNDISQWDVSSGNDFSGMFQGSLFNSNISTWVVSSGTDFSRMFSDAELFNSDLSLWDVSSGTDFSHMFSDADSFNTDISLWDVSSGTDFSGMFQDATYNTDIGDAAFNSNISQWDVSSGTDFSRMFAGAEFFNSDLSQWDVSSGIDFSEMFKGTTMNSNISQWDVSSGTDFSEMFSGAYEFNSDLSLWDVSSGTDFSRMFSFSPFNSNIAQWDVSSGTDFSGMFSNAGSFNSNISLWDVSSGRDLSGLFSQAGSFNANISQWDVSSVTDFGELFWGSSSFNSDISLWDVSSGVDFNKMFFYATSFNADISLWDVSSGMNFHQMFYHATNFNMNLCEWQVAANPAPRSIFVLSGCPYDDVTEETMCQQCSPTALPTISASPTIRPTASPTMSVAPSIDPARQFRVGLDEYYPIPSSGTMGTQAIPLFIFDEQYDCEIEDIDVEIRLQHSYEADLEAYLCHPDGTCVWLFDGIGGGFLLNGKDIILDDEASNNIATTIGDSHPVGTPESDRLSKFDGKGVWGVWVLTFNDFSGGDNGFLSSLYFDVTCAVKHPTIAPPSATLSPTASHPHSSFPSADFSFSAPATTTCDDLPGWIDSWGDDCSFYETWGCDGAELYANELGTSAHDACCICSG